MVKYFGQAHVAPQTNDIRCNFCSTQDDCDNQCRKFSIITANKVSLYNSMVIAGDDLAMPTDSSVAFYLVFRSIFILSFTNTI